MSVIPINGHDLSELAEEILQAGHRLRFQAYGSSMRPFIRAGDILEIERSGKSTIQRGDILLFRRSDSKLSAHRVVDIRIEGAQQLYVTMGDALYQPDGVIRQDQVLGRVVLYEREGKSVRLDTRFQRLVGLIWIGYSPIFKNIYWKLQSYSRKFTNFFHLSPRKF